MNSLNADVVIIGAGPAGLAAAVELRRGGVGRVLVLERENEAGGIPRHCFHTGFGWFDLRRVLSGPSYARRLVEMALAAGAEIRTNTTFLRFEPATQAGARRLLATSPDGPLKIEAAAVIFATGCRERPRAARLVPGDRPAGVFTTGSLQQLVYLKHAKIGRRAVVVGAEHVSYSAVQTLWHAGVEVVGMVTDLPRTQTYAPVSWYFGGMRGVPLYTDARVAMIRGRERVEAVDVEQVDRRTSLGCDTVVFTGDWIPDHEATRNCAVPLDPGTKGPAVDAGGRTLLPGVYAAGNCVHPAEMADYAAMGGKAVGRAVADALSEAKDLEGSYARSFALLRTSEPIIWVYPNLVSPDIAPKRGYIFRSSGFHAEGEVVAEQSGKVIWRGKAPRLVPNRSLCLPPGLEKGVDPAAGPVTLKKS